MKSLNKSDIGNWKFGYESRNVKKQNERKR